MYALHSSPKQAGLHKAAGFVAIAILSTLLGFLLSAPPARAAQTAEQFVTAGVEKGSAILNDRRLSADERRERFRSFLLSITDPRRVALFTLGSYARGASVDQLDAYIASFSDFLVAVYQKG